MKWLPLKPLSSEIKPSVSLPQPLYRMSLPFCIKMADLLPERNPFTSVSFPVLISLMTRLSAFLPSLSGTILCQQAGMHKTSSCSQSSPRYFSGYLYFSALMSAQEVLSSTICQAYTISVSGQILSKCTTCWGRRQKCSEFCYIIIIPPEWGEPVSTAAGVVSCSLMNKAIEDYILQEKIGSGQYGNVYRAQHKKTKLHYAVKVMSTDKFKQTPKLTEFTNNQISILSKISHPNIIKFVEMLCTPSNYYLVYQYCNGGTLAEYIKRKGTLSEDEALKILEQLRAAFEALYEAHILHRDIKPTNILFNNGAIKLADFGFCKELLKQNDMAQTMVGSPIYMAPEVLKGLVYDSRADLWSLGVILYEMLFGSCPYEESSIPKLITLIDSHYLKIPTEPAVSQTVKQLLLRLLTLKYRERITPAEFIRCEFGKSWLQAPKNSENTVASFKQAGKYIRKALIYLSESLQLVTREVDDIVFLRLAFMLYKTISYILKDTLSGGVYWENLSISNRSAEWQAVSSQQLAILRPYGELAREALVREDSSLKTKVELETAYVDSKYFLENIKRVDEDETRMKLLNCFIFNKHFTMVVEKRPPEWTDPTSDGLSIKEKEQLCAKFARYY